MSLLRMLAGGSAPPPTVYVEDVFGAYTRSGTGASAAVPSGVSLSTLGGLSITKSRSAATDWKWTDTVRGVTKALISDTTGAETTDANGCTAFSTTGHTVGSDTNYNNSTGPATYVDYDFAQANKFFKVAQATVSGGVTATVDLSSLGTVGMVEVKRTDSASAWFVFHRSCTSGKLVYLNTTAAETTDGSVTLSGTTLSLVGGTIANGTYIVYAWAHDTSATGLIQCGVLSSGVGTVQVPLGWEPQYVIAKKRTATSDWIISDAMRGMVVTSNGYGAELYLRGNTSAAEGGPSGYFSVNATGFRFEVGDSTDYIYLAIRRGPMKLPTVGTQVYNAIARTGTGAAATVTGVGFPPDLVIGKERGSTGAPNFTDRLRGATYELLSSGTAAEAAFANDLTSFSMDGFALGSGASGQKNTNTSTYIEECFRRYPSVFDEVCYTGTGANKTEAHNLGVAPEVWMVKGRSGATAWTVGCTALANTEYLVTNTTAAKATDATAWNSTFPSATALSLGTRATVNTNTATYVAYLFATLAGISKVGSYTGNGTSLTLNMGFAAGARFFLVKATSTTGNWWVYDSTRGIIASFDPALALNSTAAEVTTADAVDPDNSGIIVNQEATCSINANGVSYIYLGLS